MLADWEAVSAASDPDARNVLLADSRHPLDFRIGRDNRGRYFFQLEANELSSSVHSLPRLSGISCEMEELEAGRCRLSLTLHHRSDLPNFSLMCTGLMSATERLSSQKSAQGMRTSIEELYRWQDMLRRRRDNLLSKSQRIGLFGELVFLREILLPRMNARPALECWNGPDGHEQDFVIGGTIFEIKTQVVTEDRKIRISSEDQLDPVQGRILICNQGIAPVPDSEAGAETLNTLAEAIREIAGEAGAHARELFELTMLRAGFEYRAEYGEESWILVDRSCYEVSGHFPRIERGDLRVGVENVKYSVRVSACQEFSIDLDEVISEVLE